VLLAAAVAACDAQVDPAFAGDPIATVRGSAAGFGLDEVDSVAAIQWNANHGPDVPSGPLSRAPLRTRPPATLTVEVLAAPPEAAFFRLDGESAEIAEGYVFLLAPGSGAAPGRGDFVGTALDVAVVYVSGEVQPGSLTAEYLGGVRAAGYHLLEWRATAELSAPQSQLTARCAAEMVAAGTLSADAAQIACRRPRLYRLTDTPSSFDTPVTFYRSGQQ
jgi:hypothetical protein